jgi:hypothetical protein
MQEGALGIFRSTFPELIEKTEEPRLKAQDDR